MAKFIQDRVARVPSQNVRSTGGFVEIPLSGPFNMAITDPQFLLIDGGLADRDVEVPDPSQSAGAWFFIANRGATNDLLLKEGGVPIFGPMPPDSGGFIVCNGFNWTVAK